MRAGKEGKRTHAENQGVPAGNCGHGGNRGHAVFAAVHTQDSRAAPRWWSGGELICSTLLEGVVAYADEQPLIALQAGRVGKVYVCQGQTVRAGELLISMDTGVLEQELAAVNQMLYEQETALAAFGQAGEAALSAAQTALQARTRQAELRASIASAQIRAEGRRRRGGPLRGRRRYRRRGRPSGIDSWNRAAGRRRRTRGGTGKCSARSGCDGDQRGRKSAGRRRSGAVGSTGTGQQHRTGDAVAFFFTHG